MAGELGDHPRYQNALIALGGDVDATRRLITALIESCRDGFIFSVANIPLESSKLISSHMSEIILVGSVQSNGKGQLLLVDACGREQPVEIHLVVAPPPSIYIRDALVWIKTWRLIKAPRKTSRSVGFSYVCETLQSDLVVLRAETREAPPPNSLRPLRSISESSIGRVDTFGYILCKSSVMGRRSKKPAFLVELGSKAAGSVNLVCYVVFTGSDVTRWWPYFVPGRFVVLCNLFIASLPRCGSRLVLRAAGRDFNAYDHLPSYPRLSSSRLSHPNHDKKMPIGKRKGIAKERDSFQMKRLDLSKRSHCAENAALPLQNLEARLKQNLRLVSYTGEITKVMGDGRYVLDQVVIVHLGWYGGWCAGPEESIVCFRLGSHITILNAVLAVRRGRACALFPTARSFAFINYFGSVGMIEASPRSYRSSPWRHLWKRLIPFEVVWAEELYAEIGRKFGTWLAPSRISNVQKEACDDMGAARAVTPTSSDVILGSWSDRGLILHIMNVSDVGSPRRRYNNDLYAEFLEMENGNIPLNFRGIDYQRSIHPVVPTVCDISNAVDVLVERNHPAKESCRAESCLVENSFCKLMFHVVEVGDLLNVLLGLSLPGYSKKMSSRPPSQDMYATCSGCSDAPSAHHICTTVDTEIRSMSTGDSEFVTEKTVGKDMKGVLLIGILEPCNTFAGDLQLVDSSGAVSITVFGKLPLKYFGAMVVTSTFSILVRQYCGGSRHSFIAVNVIDLRIVVDGPYNSISTSQGCCERDLECSLTLDCDADYQISFKSRSLDRLPDSRKHPSPSETLTLACNAEAYPLVSVLVSSVSVVWRNLNCDTQVECDGTSATGFCVNGYLMAYKGSPKIEVWTLLSDDIAGFQRCCLIVEGARAVALRAVIHPKAFYAITCTDVPSTAESFQIWLSNMKLEAVRRKSVAGPMWNDAVLLTTRGAMQQLYVEDLEECNAMRSNSDAFVTDQEKLLDMAVRMYRRMEDTENVDVLSIRMFKQLPSHAIVSSREARVSVVGTVLEVCERPSRRACKIFEKFECDQVIRVRHERLPLFIFEIFVLTDVVLPNIVFPGVKISFLHVSAFVSKEVDITCLILTENSSIEFNGVNETRTCLTSAFCCNRPLNVTGLLTQAAACHLSEFCSARLYEQGDLYSPLRYTRCAINKIVFVAFYCRPLRCGEETCNTCGCKGTVLDAYAVVEADDGTAELPLMCRGYREVTELLGATNEESLLLRDHVIDCGQIVLDLSDQSSADTSLCSATLRERTRRVPLLARLISCASRPIVCFLDYLRKVRHGEASADLAFELRSNVALGRGRKLFTALCASKNKFSLRCMATLEESSWSMAEGGIGSSNVIRNLLSASDI